ncbi:EVE domain-containing protein [Rubinisphaera sp.]|uniref:EVE domain-containing protein n=1 Tax=Rubinisphaera sp. TaxID=2024857 RepID=UPI000C11B3B6|nr:EVE domain-containing protein [Rubinisphaera sp.]MBV10362.1 EVE domain-containing protein [Rubinisphaera sp.]HCS51267.1 EVE domain-containing protein [Planctomycetaceae bacterium]|tara:strand:- start:10853 stop:11389 length:537 start_codon:yes stop_codon:yes gene_type:complete
MPAKKSTSSKTEKTQSAKSSEKRFWLFKSEESCYSIDHLAAESNKTTFWDGIRNYQARNMLRDDVQKGDLVFFYHSNTDPLAIAGTARVVKAGYADHTAFDPIEKHYDPKSNPDEPTWYMVDIKFVKKFPQPVTRAMLKEDPVTANMMVLARGSRLSVQPVTQEEWEAVHRLAGVKAP